eukprot:TRINITY_DN14089_c0_g1_i1.p1 TRINITY_DN14089_c0_g1~~TRINITY_DN14089_c0_g1_i1.p1  ORF type:complete len:276 (+),score=43.14 TRINITY_DN14089_c0_g1_i1:206-1033(+)
MKSPHLPLQHQNCSGFKEPLFLQLGSNFVKPLGHGDTYFKRPHSKTLCDSAVSLPLACRLVSKLSASSTKRSSSPAFFQEEDDEDSDDEDRTLSCCRGLVLDVSYRPVHVVGWRRAICLEFLQKADVLVYYDQTVSSLGGSFYIPAVLKVTSLVEMKRRMKKVYLNRKNVLGRDLFTCQYCRSTKDLTVDHVLPVSRGGKWTWENLVTACSECNSRKGNKTLQEAQMKLIRTPKAPKDYDTWGLPLTTSTYKALKDNKRLPDEWRDFLSGKMFIC